MQSFNTQLTKLRQHFNTIASQEREPNKEDWTTTCSLLEEIPAADLNIAVDYVLEHIEVWSAALREPPERWLETLCSGEREPRLRLCSLFREPWPYTHTPAEIVQALCTHELINVENIELNGHYDGAAGSNILRAIASSPHLTKLHHLFLECCDFDLDAFTFFAKSTRRLTNITLIQQTRLDLNAVLELVRTAPAFEEVTSIQYDHVGPPISGEGLIALLDSPRGSQLTDLHLGEWPLMEGSPVPKWIYDHSAQLTNLQNLSIGQMYEEDWEIREDLSYRYEMSLE